ncbi:recombinase family protein [Solibacillus sp. R5-41]|uniref:recombinase family protein n=1 Tax=Solibacillus sp. R5-41 TaxID=2048654 RepID=UPI00352E7692
MFFNLIQIIELYYKLSILIKGYKKIYTEKKSGKDFSRLVYREMRSKMRFGDLLVIYDLGRFGRNKQEILNEWKRITDDEIDIVVVNLPILDTRKY